MRGAGSRGAGTGMAPIIGALLMVGALLLGGSACAPDGAADLDVNAAEADEVTWPSTVSADGIEGGVPAHLPIPAARTAPQAVSRGLPVRSSEPVEAPLGFGRSATADEIAEWDIDVRPDGTGLPPGSGTAEEGVPIYAAQCASCHGAQGEGTPAGWPLIGRNPGDVFDFNESLAQEERRVIGNYWPHATTIYDYIRRSMPMDRPGHLSDDDVYALTAWILWRTLLIEPDEVMDAESLPGVVMPSADRFVPDDRPR